MARKCFISFKTEDWLYKIEIQRNPNIDIVDKSLDEPVDSDNQDYIMQKIRSDYLSDSTVTLHLIGTRSAETLGYDEQEFIKRELQASLYDRENNRRSAILGIVLPTMYDRIYKGGAACSTCGKVVSIVSIRDDTVVREFSYNYYIPHGKCHWSEQDRYCVLVRWDDFIKAPEKYIEEAFAKREQPIANKVKVRP
jgi:hypothetical protein